MSDADVTAAIVGVLLALCILGALNRAGWTIPRMWDAIHTGAHWLITPRPTLSQQIEAQERELKPWEEWRP